VRSTGPPLLLPRDGIGSRGVLEGRPRLSHLLDADARHLGFLVDGHHSALMFAARITSR
jgi:hypothetical protein